MNCGAESGKRNWRLRRAAAKVYNRLYGAPGLTAPECIIIMDVI